MELLTLPNEMLTSIMKYKTFNRIVELRKLNKQIDTAAKEYDVGTRLPVQRLSIFNNFDEAGTWVLELDIRDYKNGPQIISRVNSTVINKPLFEGLKMITDMLEVYDEVNPFDNDFLNIFQENWKYLRNITYFDVICTSTCLSKQLLNFIKSLTKLDEIRAMGTFIDSFCNPEIYRGRKWKKISLRSRSEEFETDKLNDDFLLAFLHNCEQFEIFCEDEKTMTFTLPTIIQLFQDAASNGRLVNWEFAQVPLGYLTRQEAFEIFQKIPESRVKSERQSVIYQARDQKRAPLIECEVFKYLPDGFIDVTQSLKVYVSETHA